MLDIVHRERQKSLMLRTWILSGLFFMALPGTLLGFSNLIAISTSHGASPLPAAWMQGHGHAQVFGWIGSFILGIGFYSQPAKSRFAVRLPQFCFILWTPGVALRWFTSIYGWQWRIMLPVSAASELAAYLLFLKSASGHKRETQSGAEEAKMPVWMVSVLVSTAGLFAAIAFNFVECVNLAVRGAEPAFPHALDQRYLVLLGWGVLVPVVWGFSARWLPSFLGIARTHQGSTRRGWTETRIGTFDAHFEPDQYCPAKPTPYEVLKREVGSIPGNAEDANYSFVWDEGDDAWLWHVL